ncbi:hypothetical protein, partial [Rosenbergiella gaditana]|uniref:hypothetical protein n=1 Tax=Rosenbergiella gaditana TaxID=2726987 RepID=UPI001BDA8F3C
IEISPEFRLVENSTYEHTDFSGGLPQSRTKLDVLDNDGLVKNRSSGINENEKSNHFFDVLSKKLQENKNE